jgi:6,7-dimethyl-8-ribityllumazine synthase
MGRGGVLSKILDIRPQGVNATLQRILLNFKSFVTNIPIRAHLPTLCYADRTLSIDLPDRTLDGSNLRIAVAVSRFNEHITTRLLAGALEALERCGVKEHAVHWVPGAFELPTAALHLAKSGRYDAIICLGCVVRHETNHHQYVAGGAATGIQRAAMDTGVPCIFGVLTCDTDEQALARSGGARGNAGASAVETAVETANLLRSL